MTNKNYKLCCAESFSPRNDFWPNEIFQAVGINEDKLEDIVCEGHFFANEWSENSSVSRIEANLRTLIEEIASVSRAAFFVLFADAHFKEDLSRNFPSIVLVRKGAFKDANGDLLMLYSMNISSEAPKVFERFGGVVKGYWGAVFFVENNGRIVIREADGVIVRIMNYDISSSEVSLSLQKMIEKFAENARCLSSDGNA